MATTTPQHHLILPLDNRLESGNLLSRRRHLDPVSIPIITCEKGEELIENARSLFFVRREWCLRRDWARHGQCTSQAFLFKDQSLPLLLLSRRLVSRIRQFCVQKVICVRGARPRRQVSIRVVCLTLACIRRVKGHDRLLGNALPTLLMHQIPKWALAERRVRDIVQGQHIIHVGVTIDIPSMNTRRAINALIAILIEVLRARRLQPLVLQTQVIDMHISFRWAGCVRRWPREQVALPISIHRLGDRAELGFRMVVLGPENAAEADRLVTLFFLSLLR